MPGLIAASDGPPLDPLSAFLLETLRARRALHTRNGMAYVTLRTWRQAVKPTQVSAFKALKLVPPAPLVAAASDEMTSAAVGIFGRYFGCVVPVPGGSSGRRYGLSVMLGEAIAARLGCPCRDVIRFEAERGGSTPRKAGRLKPFKVIEVPAGPVLLVDDVATSGRHLELAHGALTATGVAVLSMAWIGT